MFETYRAIVDWQKSQRGRGGCLDTDSGLTPCAYIQFHGKGKRTCRKEKIFLSAGLGTPLLHLNGAWIVTQHF